MSDPRTQALIASMATQRGLDPRAVEAIASVEGGYGGAVGDNGTSFGPFQLHQGGALPSQFNGNPQAAAQWASSPAGIAYALNGINKVAHGLRGQAAIAAISRQFERPADPAAEIAKATARYGGITSPGTRGLGGTQTSSAAGLGGAQVSPMLALAMQLVSNGGESPILQLAQQRLQLAAAHQAFGPQPSAGSQILPPSEQHNLFAPVSGKIIGDPYQGTHAQAFNAKGGSDNWESENAVDVATPVGTPIRAVTSGVIGPQFGSLGEGGRFAGLRLHLKGGGNEYYYAHLSKFAPGIKPGAKVKAGQILGYSGEANGVAHLHFASQSGNPLSFYKS